MKNRTNTLASGNYSTSLNMFVYQEVPSGSECLDIGCWNGNLGEMLIREKNCSVDGVDVNEEMLEQAQKKGYRHTYVINLNSENIQFSEIKRKYDVIMFADVLEHLINPELVLKLAKTKLKKKGRIIISLPNVAFILNRIQLLLGRWEYREFGTLDKTHLKFYTVESGRKMVESTGLKVRKIQPYNQFGMLPKIEPLKKLFPNLLSYQFLIVCDTSEE